MSCEAIAAALDIPEETALTRIFRMWDAGVISEYRIKVNPLLFGYHTAIVLAEAYRSYCKQKDVRSLRTMDRVTAMVETTGKIYSAYLLYTDEADLRRLVDVIRAKIAPSRVTSVLCPLEPPIALKLSGQDWRIVERLMDDPRESVDNMSRDLCIAPGALGKRMEKLFDAGAVTPTVVIQPGLFEGMTSHRLYVVFRDGSDASQDEIIKGISDQWNLLRLEKPPGAVVDIYGKTRKGIEDDLRFLKGLDCVKETFYTTPSRNVSSDLLLRKKVVEIVYRSDVSTGL